MNTERCERLVSFYSLLESLEHKEGAARKLADRSGWATFTRAHQLVSKRTSCRQLDCINRIVDGIFPVLFGRLCRCRIDRRRLDVGNHVVALVHCREILMLYRSRNFGMDDHLKA